MSVGGGHRQAADRQEEPRGRPRERADEEQHLAPHEQGPQGGEQAGRERVERDQGDEGVDLQGLCSKQGAL